MTVCRPFSSSCLLRLAAVCTLLALAVLAPPAAAAPAPDVNETCLACHGDKDAKRADGRSIAVEGATFAQSVHGQMQLKCTDCHSDVSVQKLPHPEKLNPVVCASCHAAEVREYEATVHGVARKGGNTIAATCTDCHGTHDIKR